MENRSTDKSMLLIEYEIQCRMEEITKVIREWDYVDEELEKLKKEYWRAKIREEYLCEASPIVSINHVSYVFNTISRPQNLA